MIKKQEYHSLLMDYSSMYQGNNHPSDIDMFYLGKDECLILGEIKNERYNPKNWENQKKLLEPVIDNYTKEAICLFIVHNRYAQNGDKVVNVPECYVKEYYYKKPHYKAKWATPREKIKVKEVLEKYGSTN